MVNLKNKDIKEILSNLGLDEKSITTFCKYINEKDWFEAIKIYKKLEITRKNLDSKDKIYVLLKVDNKGYDVNLEIDKDKLIHFCNCSHREDDNGCEHAGAVLLYKMLQKEKNDFNHKIGNILLSKEKEKDLDYFKGLFPNIPDVEKKSMIYFNFEEFNKDRQLLKVQKGNVKKDSNYGIPIKFVTKDFDSPKWQISKNTRNVLRFIDEGDNYGISYTNLGFIKTKFNDVSTDLIMPILRRSYFEEQEIILGAVFSNDKFKIVWEIEKKNDLLYTLEPFFVTKKRKSGISKMNLVEMGINSLWVFDCNRRCFYEYADDLNLEIVRSIIKNPKKLELNEEELKDFFSKYYQKILNNFDFNISDDLQRKSKCVIPKATLYLERLDNKIKIKLKFDYASREVNYFSSNKEIILVEKNIIYNIPRDFEQEDEIVEQLNSMGVITHDELDYFVIEGDLIDFVMEKIPKIIEKGIQIMGEEKLFNFKVVKHKPTMNLNITKKVDWLDIKGTIKFGQDSVDIQDVLETIFKNKRFIDLSDGKKAVIPQEWINSLKCYSGLVQLENSGAKLSQYHMAILNNLIEFSADVSMDNNVQKMLTIFKEFEKIKPEKISKNVHAELRPYQKAGYDWLCFLNKSGFNGILADDMGLGKTLQTLSLFQKIKDEKNKNTKPLLVITPTSLVFNWKNEIQKFTPNLKVYVHHGTKRINSNQKIQEIIKNNDLIITTYGVLKNDLELFSKITFEYIVLDEAHIIKNPQSINAKSVCSLNGKNKLAISGTPIQNNLMELWSLFNFLNPGYLGGYNFFKETFMFPIEKNQDKDVNASLKKIISPFLLRRTKKIIADELPEKNEIILKSDFSESERRNYDEWKEYYKEEIRVSITQNGFSKSKMKILEGLTKLRQICLHPKMVDPEYKGSSSKFDLLMIEIEKILEEGHKVLVFSSFVKMLSIIKEDLESKGIKYSYLDGQTPNREKVVSKFQESEKALPFLISIKAGGLGLNLTSADYVFIVDPWWNPAVEMQAMDRAHRIGQDKKVFVYKMIAQDSIEEKILKLQESKKKLVEDLIVEEKSLLKEIDLKGIESLFE